MIARIWHGYTTAENAPRYEAIKKPEMLPGIRTVQGYVGSYLLRRPKGREVEFVVIMLWESLDAIRNFVGSDYEAAVVHPECGALLSRYDERSAHYEIVMQPPARDLTVRSTAPEECCASLNVEPFRVQMIRETSCVSLVRFDHPPGTPLPTSYSSHDAAENFRVNIVERGWFKLKYGRREWTLGAGSMFLSRPTEVYGYSHVKYAEPDTCLRVEFYGPVAGELADFVFRLPLVLPKTNRLGFLRLRLGSLLSNAAEMSLDALACEVVDAAANAGLDRRRLYRSEQLRWYAERIGAARERMDCDPTADHSLWHLSAQVGMSVFQFARVFRELVGIPPHKYLVRRRLHRARDLLRSGMPVTDVCYAAGFNNLSHFIRTFRAYFGTLPSELKSSFSAPAARGESPLQ